MEIYSDAYFNIGMRFHSVVLQTISSDKNCVLDSTEPKKGKTYGLLSDIEKIVFVMKDITRRKDNSRDNQRYR